MDLYLIRHTTPKVDAGTCYGQLNLDVTDTFAEEAEQIKLQLPKTTDAVYSSPLTRCQKLAEYVYPGQAKTDPRILEFDFGDWEGLKWTDIPQDALMTWMENYLELAPPNGETMKSMVDRVRNFVEEITKSNAKCIAIFTHSGAIRVLHHLINDLALEDIFSLTVDYGTVIHFQLTNEPKHTVNLR